MKLKRSTRGFGLIETILAKKRAKLADKLIEEKYRNGRILDVGCGLFPHFLMLTKFKEKHGIDYIIDKSKFNHQQIFLKKINIEKEKMPYTNNYFDVVIMLAVFEHINPENLQSVLNEIFRILKRDGVFILTTPSPWSVPLLWFLSRIKIISKVEIDDHKNSFDAIKIKKMVQMAGFSKNKIRNGYFELFLNMWTFSQK